jgi:hypothetical protein
MKRDRETQFMPIDLDPCSQYGPIVRLRVTPGIL